jgi:hypothetical protein
MKVVSPTSAALEMRDGDTSNRFAKEITFNTPVFLNGYAVLLGSDDR